MSTPNLTEVNMHISGLEDRQTELLKKRKKIIENLNDIDKEAHQLGIKRRMKFNRQNNNDEPITSRLKKRRPEGDIQDVETNSTQRKILTTGRHSFGDTRPRMLSAIIVKKEDSAKKENKNDQEFSKIVTERPPVQKVPEEVKDRGRNFLKQANIYLKKAKIDLSSQNTLLEKQKEASEKAFSKVIQENEVLKEKQKKTNEEKKISELGSKQNTEKELLKNENELTYARVKKNYLLLTNFIQTKEKPSIFWLPQRHNEISQSLLQETKTKIIAQTDEIMKNSEKSLATLIGSLTRPPRGEQKRRETEPEADVEEENSEDNGHKLADNSRDNNEEATRNNENEDRPENQPDNEKNEQEEEDNMLNEIIE